MVPSLPVQGPALTLQAAPQELEPPSSTATPKPSPVSGTASTSIHEHPLMTGVKEPVTSDLSSTQPPTNQTVKALAWVLIRTCRCKSQVSHTLLTLRSHTPSVESRMFRKSVLWCVREFGHSCFWESSRNPNLRPRCVPTAKLQPHQH